MAAFGQPSAAPRERRGGSLRSKVWGTLAWAGYGDHLDVVGDYGADPPGHINSLWSGSGFDAEQFRALVDVVTAGILSSVRAR